MKLKEILYVSSRPPQKCSIAKVFSKNFTKFKEKHLKSEVRFYKFARLQPATLLKRNYHRCFPVNNPDQRIFGCFRYAVDDRFA